MALALRANFAVRTCSRHLSGTANLHGRRRCRPLETSSHRGSSGRRDALALPPRESIAASAAPTKIRAFSPALIDWSRRLWRKTSAAVRFVEPGKYTTVRRGWPRGCSARAAARNRRTPAGSPAPATRRADAQRWPRALHARVPPARRGVLIPNAQNPELKKILVDVKPAFQAAAMQASRAYDRSGASKDQPSLGKR